MTPSLAGHLQVLGLARAPFPPTPDAAAWFQTRRLEGELFEAAHCLRTRAGFVLVTGEVGTGKTTFLRRLLHELDGDSVVTSMVFNTFLQGHDLLVAVLRDFGLTPRGNPAADIETLNRFLVQRWQSGATCVLVIDDAQNLTIESLELLRLLTNLETGQEKLLQIVLSGQPELRDALDQPRLRQLTSRICKHVRLEPMDAAGVADYVAFRLAAAGNPEHGVRLHADAAPALHRATAGNARRVHLVMDRCLYGLYGLAPDQRVVDARLVRKAAAEAGALPARRMRRVPLAAAACLAAALALSPLLLLIRSSDSRANDRPSAPPAPAAASAPASGDRAEAAWAACLQALRGDVHVETVPEPRVRRLPVQAAPCTRGDGDGWQAAWPVSLRAEHFIAANGAHARLVAVQALLRDRGLYDGELDGIYGTRMRAGIARLQLDHGLVATGSPDPATLFLIDTLLASGDAARPNTTEPHSDVHG